MKKDNSSDKKALNQEQQKIQKYSSGDRNTMKSDDIEKNKVYKK